eukprot:4175204-Pyramimonas_sp.AAC.1
MRRWGYSCETLRYTPTAPRTTVARLACSSFRADWRQTRTWQFLVLASTSYQGNDCQHVAD